MTNFQLTLEPPRVKVYEEYLVYDMISMIRAIGGTMGLCIGFSFTDFACTTLRFIEKAIHQISTKIIDDNKIQPSDNIQKGVTFEVKPVLEDVNQKIDKLKHESEMQVQLIYRLEAKLLALERNNLNEISANRA